MLRFSQPITPAIQDYMNAQVALLADMSGRTFHSVQKINELNFRIAQAMLKDSFKSVQQVLTAQDPVEAVSIVAAQAHPAAEKLREYQQGLTSIAAGVQVELARAAESHVPHTSRTAAAVADEVARRAAEATEQATQRQRTMYENAASAASRPDAGKGGGTAGANVH